MGRKLFNLAALHWMRIISKGLAICSLLMAVFLAAVWVRSATHWDKLWVSFGGYRVGVTTDPGALNISLMHSDGPPVDFDWRFVPSKIDQPVGHHWFSFNWGHGTGMEWDHQRQARYRLAGTGLMVSIWILILFCCWPLLPPLTRWVRSSCGKWRGMPGCCATCGYDLRATPERCPECGRVSC